MSEPPKDQTITEMEPRHCERYSLDPIQPDEFEDWSEAQAWEEESLEDGEINRLKTPFV